MSKGLFEAIRISATGLRGQRLKMDVVARNLANAETTRTSAGTPYRRQRAVFEEVLEGSSMRTLNRAAGGASSRGSRLAQTHAGHRSGLAQRVEELAHGVKADVTPAADASRFRVVFDPGHPDADLEGYVLMPNVNPITEMVDLIAASRAYEANISAVQAAKDMFSQALKI